MEQKRPYQWEGANVASILISNDIMHWHVVHGSFLHYIAFLWRVDNVAVAGEDADVGCSGVEGYNIS